MELAIAFILAVGLILGLMELKDWRAGRRFEKLSAEIRGQRRKLDELNARVSVAMEGLSDAADSREVMNRVDTAVQGLIRDYEVKLRVSHEGHADFVTGM